MHHIYYVILIALALYSTYTDIKRREIDNGPLIASIIIGLVLFLFEKDVPYYTHLLGFLYIGALMLLISFLGMGGGDVKLISVIGLYVGFRDAMIIVFFISAVGCLESLYYLFKYRNGKNDMPFAPSITGGLILYRIINLIL